MERSLGSPTGMGLGLGRGQGERLNVPRHCFLGQHAVAGEEGDAADDGQVLEGLKHVQVGPVDVHEAQHG